MKSVETWRKHIKYCEYNNIKPVSMSVIYKRLERWWSEAKTIITPHQWHWGARTSQWITITDEYRKWMKDNNVKTSRVVYYYNYSKWTLDRLLNKLKWKQNQWK